MKPLHQLLQADIAGAYAQQGRDSSLKHMVNPFVFSCFLVSRQIRDVSTTMMVFLSLAGLLQMGHSSWSVSVQHSLQ